MSACVSVIAMGYDESVSCCKTSMYVVIPFDTANMRAIPIIPMLPANEVSKVRRNLVNKLRSDNINDMAKDMDGFFLPFSFSFFAVASLRHSFASFAESGLVSPTISPSSMLIILVE